MFIRTAHRLLMAALPALLLLACHAARTPAMPPERTAFYTIEAERDSVKRQTSFRIVKVQVVDAKINYHADEAKAKSRDFLKIEILHPKAPPVLAYTEHPLSRKFDLYEEHGEISSKLISLPKGQVTIRVPYAEAYKSVRITETLNFKTESKPFILRHEKN